MVVVIVAIELMCTTDQHIHRTCQRPKMAKCCNISRHVYICHKCLTYDTILSCTTALVVFVSVALKVQGGTSTVLIKYLALMYVINFC